MAAQNPMAYVVEPGVIEFRDSPPPMLGSEDVKVQVRAVTLCGSDLHIFKGKHPVAQPPVAVGHEIAGEVIELGEAVDDLTVGDHVAIEPIINCQRCHYCRRGDYHLCTDISFQYRVGQGGITNEFVVASHWAHKLPPALPFEVGALMEPLSVAVHASKNADVRMGQTIAIFGGGSIGLLLLMTAKAIGAGTAFVIDVQDFNLEQAKALGADHTLHNMRDDTLAEISRLTNSMGVDIAFEAVGLEQTLVQALKSTKKGGTAAVIGLFEQDTVELPANLFVQREIQLVGSQGYCWDFQTSIQLVEQGHLDLSSLITHRFSMEQTQEAFDLLAAPDNNAIKIAIVLD